MNNTHSGAEHHASAEENKVEPKGKGMTAIFAYLWILIIIPFFTEDYKKDPFVRFHVKQGLALIVFDVIGWIVAAFIGWLPIIGWLIVWLWWLVSLIFVVIGILNVLSGHEKELPIIGSYAKSFNF